MDVVIVESPAKAKTINKYLGKNFEVIASFGHVRDLPAKDGSVDPDSDFKMLWEVDGKAGKRLSDIAAKVKNADRIVLATDPDREGEAISWHVLEVLRAKRVLKDKPVERVVFNAITKDAILEAMKHPRQIDENLVEAYLARRALDYLVGFNLSPVLWRKLPGARSAGRVQSVALRLVCDRELEIEKFVAREYWSLVAHLRNQAGAPFTARLVGADGKKITRLDIGAGAEAEGFKRDLENAVFRVVSVEAKPAKRHPYAPFTTSTLQQEASRKLGMAPEITMRVAQKLYEGVDLGGETVGLITYMRTDGVDVAPEAVASARAVIGREFGDRYVPGVPRKYQVKAKNAQEAHEAIRPTDVSRLPKDMARHLQADQARLYELIWTRMVASQMESAVLERTVAEIEAKAGGRVLDVRATGQVVRFDGFLKLYQEGKDDEEDEDSGRLPPLAPDEILKKDKIDATQHFTEPPPRYTEATLVKRMEELGIGRPSTYASTLAVLRERDYVKLDKKRLVPEDKGRLVTAFLESFFGRYVQYDFTAALEEQLDRVSNSEIDWKQVLRDFWRDFSIAIDGTRELRTTQVLDSLNDLLGPHIFPAKENGSNPRACPVCADGQLSLKLGKFGAFIGCSNYPECKYTRTLSNRGGEANGVEGERPGVKVLGEDPKTGKEITLRDGRFGAYVQEGQDAGKDDKPRRSSLSSNLKPEDVTLEKALALLSLPREVAKHPETGEPILAGIGRYGAYVQHKKTYANLAKDDDVLEIGANRAIDLIVTKEAGGGARGSGGEIRALGDHPEGGAITLKAGRFGPYLAWGKVNATLPRGTDMTGLTLEKAVELVNAKAAGAPSGGGRVLGEHPDGGQVTARAGRYGPYVSWEKISATLPKSMTLDDIGLEQAIRLIEDKIDSGGAKKPAKKAPAKKTAAAKKTAVAKKPAAKGAKAKPEIVDSDEPPFEPDAPAKKPARKKPAGKD
ncbi:type I DNA topoisomerase [Rhodoblastus acidophilus]|uniref:DNA topoisomerase 1 n=1 Tax=Candidatus Rhodoblastus alkanivorans TaxID=2954117 RepID=A0ABS9Z7V0_9HYPH|nr:type I DNA topoisomerase [Candidatus Rhodoblastus alkanivorans]MCI4678977.1 type I DNA topoisomerase [Candidatus Rhodoblastus alkanivorans]MCI4683755.1 type I DNA topoisomerase [Candidatus Rhodoblastus alkanivorans]MDI4641073.1 type I DNA topoisomerase [Rhodoblastus acidophilus]